MQLVLVIFIMVIGFAFMIGGPRAGGNVVSRITKKSFGFALKLIFIPMEYIAGELLNAFGYGRNVRRHPAVWALLHLVLYPTLLILRSFARFMVRLAE